MKSGEAQRSIAWKESCMTPVLLSYLTPRLKHALASPFSHCLAYSSGVSADATSTMPSVISHRSAAKMNRLIQYPFMTVPSA